MAEIQQWCETCRRYGSHSTKRHQPEDMPAVQCPDGGACHHQCQTKCWRVRNAGPLSIAKYPGDQWPVEVLREHAPDRLPYAERTEEDDRRIPTLATRLSDAGFSAERRAVIAAEVKDWLMDYVPYGFDPTEPIAELEGK